MHGWLACCLMYAASCGKSFAEIGEILYFATDNMKAAFVF